MSTTTKKAFRLLKKATRFLLFFLLAVIILVNLFIVLSGRYYIYTGIRHTYLVGQMGPNIYERDIFPYKTLDRSSKPEYWKISSEFNTFQLNAKDLAFVNSIDTRALLVFRGDTLVYEKYFDKHSINTVSNSFSAAKTVVALLVGIAVEEGKIKSLDEPVGNYLPEFTSQGREKITIRHLLMMASGLDWEESSSNPLSENAESYYGTDLHGLVTGQKAITTPGKLFNYQSGNSQLLGYVVEKATGMSVAEYSQEKIWRRIGTEHEAYWSLDKENGDEKAFCCLYATARDFGRLGKLLLQNGKWGNEQIVPQWYMKEMSTPVKMNTEEGVPNHRYGLHVWTYEDHGKPITYCRGIKGQYVIAVPDQNLVIVRLGLNRNDNFVIPEEKKNDKKYCIANEQKIGHPTDFFDFLELGRRIGKKH
jgi:CubicO group peptidase (beta-lactamase class C family)